VFEGQLSKLDLFSIVFTEIIIMNGLGQGYQIGPFFCIGDDNDLFNGREFFDNASNLIQAVQCLSLEEIAVGAEENLGPGLAESIEHPLDAEIRGAG